VEHSQFCLNYGKGTRISGKHINWNSEIIWKMRTELDFQWDLLEEEIPKVLTALQAVSITTFKNLKLQLAREYYR
jgi:hypothetical protein